MKILSVVWGTCSTAALAIDGEIAACVSEERFSRVKNDDRYPLNAIEAVLRQCGLTPKDIDIVAFAGKDFPARDLLCNKWSRFSASDRLREQRDYWYPKIFENKTVDFLEVFKDKVNPAQYPGQWSEAIDFLKKGDQAMAEPFFQEFRRNAVHKHLGIDPAKVVFIDHHFSHGCYAYYASPLRDDKLLLLTADAWGDGANATISFIEKGRIDHVSSSNNFIIGRLYRYITLLLGMKPDEHEYKVMGLAAYSKPEYYKKALEIFENTMYVDGLGFSYREKPKDLYFHFRDRLEGVRFDSIAGAIQRYTEEILAKWAQNALEASGARKICFGGGVAMNIKAVMEMLKLDALDDIFICPTPSDESLAIGAAYAVMNDICLQRGEDPRFRIKPLKDSYLGPSSGEKAEESVAALAKSKGYNVTKNPDRAYVSGLVGNGGIIGRCAGRSEFGARALGNRSIIADPRDPNAVKAINEKIKCRDFWMPFAPTILSERADDYLVNPKSIKSPYMTIAFETKKAAWRDLKAALHQYDMTARPQILTRSDNPEYHSLISSFANLTGVGGVLNTSFNVHGEPIVQTPRDAFDVFERTNLDALLLDSFLIE